MNKITKFFRNVLLSPLSILMGGNITASTAARDFIASRLTTASGVNYFATCHGTTNLPVAGSSYIPRVNGTELGELATGNGYVAGGVKLGTAVNAKNPSFPGTCTAAAGVLDFGAGAGDGDAKWYTSAGETLTVDHTCLWMSTAATLDATAKLVCMKQHVDPDRIGSGDVGYVKATFNNTVTIPTPA